jgi:hypothetical protein
LKIAREEINKALAIIERMILDRRGPSCRRRSYGGYTQVVSDDLSRHRTPSGLRSLIEHAHKIASLAYEPAITDGEVPGGKG